MAGFRNPLADNNRGPSISLNLLDKLSSMILEGRESDQYLKHMHIGGVTYATESQMPRDTIYLGIPNDVDGQPREMGSTSVMYQDRFIIEVYFYHAPVEDRIDPKVLYMARDMLREFFISCGSIGGLCNGGVQVHNPRITQALHDFTLYSVVAMEIVGTRTIPRNRGTI